MISEVEKLVCNPSIEVVRDLFLVAENGPVKIYGFWVQEVPTPPRKETEDPLGR